MTSNLNQLKTPAQLHHSGAGTVYLNVADLDHLLAFYQGIIGLRVLRSEGSTAYLGTGSDELLVLTETPDAERVAGTAGLYHFALLVPSRYDLGRSLHRLAETRTPLQGLSDHYVSEAIYLADPEGNGIEIYRDRPMNEWFVDGEMRMGTVPMDVDGVIGTLEGQNPDWTGVHPDTRMGHIHLHVSSVPQTEAFYRDVLGFDVLFNMGSAVFMSFNGYHHHIGANIWAGRAPQPDHVLGLDKYVIRLADSDQRDAIAARLDAANMPVETLGENITFRDPSQIRVVLTIA